MRRDLGEKTPPMLESPISSLMNPNIFTNEQTVVSPENKGRSRLYNSQEAPTHSNQIVAMIGHTLASRVKEHSPNGPFVETFDSVDLVNIADVAPIKKRVKPDSVTPSSSLGAFTKFAPDSRPITAMNVAVKDSQNICKCFSFTTFSAVTQLIIDWS